MILVFILLAAISAVGIWKNEQAKEHRKRIEKRKAKEYSEQLEYGSFELKKGACNWQELDQWLNLRDEVNFKVDNRFERIEIHVGEKVIGKVPLKYEKFNLMLESLLDGRIILGACIKKNINQPNTENQIIISYEAK